MEKFSEIFRNFCDFLENSRILRNFSRKKVEIFAIFPKILINFPEISKIFKFCTKIFEKRRNYTTYI